MARHFTIGLAAALLSAILAATALGHTDVAGTVPRDGATLDTPPAAITVTYGSALGGVRSALVIADRDEVSGMARLAPRNARQLIIPIEGGGPGRYRAEWVVLAADGHAIEGAVEFTVRPPSLRTSLLMLAREARTTAAALRTIG